MSNCILIKVNNEFNFNTFKSNILNSETFKKYKNDFCSINGDEEFTKKEYIKFNNSIDKLTFHKINKDLILIDNSYITEFFVSELLDNIPKNIFNNIICLIYMFINKPNFIKYEDLNEIINITINNPSIEEYYINKNHSIQYITDTLENGIFTEYSYTFIEFNVKKYNKLIYDKIFELYSNDINKLKNIIIKNIIIDLSSLFSDDIKIIYDNKNFINQ